MQELSELYQYHRQLKRIHHYEFEMHLRELGRDNLAHSNNRYGEVNYTANATIDIDRFSFKTE